MRLNSIRKMLINAMHFDDSSQFRLILEKEGWPLDSEWSDYELLMYAIKHNHRRITHVLLDKGARVKKDNVRYLTSPLHSAAVKKTTGWLKVIARLLSLGASISYKNGKGDTSLHAAFKSHAPDEIIDMLLMAYLQKSSTDVFNRDLMGFIHIACTRPNVDVVREFLEADLSLVNRQLSLKPDSIYAGYTPLHFAVDHGRLEIAKYLLDQGANIYMPNVNGSTALHLALELRNIEMTDLLLSYDKLYINRVNNFGLSHFMAACAGSNENLVDAYLQKTLSTSALISSQVQDIKHYPNSSYTPLHFAAEFGRQRTVKLLLSRGVDCCTLAMNNVTSHVLAHNENHKKIACLLDKQCRIFQWSTESPKALGNRYDPIIDHDEQGNVMFKFEKKDESCFSSEFENSSSDQGSVKSEDTNVDIARLSHEDLVAYFTKDDALNAVNQCDIPSVIDFPQNTESLKVESVESQITESLVNKKGNSVTFDFFQHPLEGAHFCRADENFSNYNVQVSSLSSTNGHFQQIPNSSFNFTCSDSFSHRNNSMNSQFSIPNDFSSFNPAASVSMPNNSQAGLQSIYYETISNNSNQVSSIQNFTNSSDVYIQAPELPSIPWSISSSSNQFDFSNTQHTNNDSGLDHSSLFISSYFADSGISQDNSHSGLFQDNSLNNVPSHISQSFDEIDYAGFFSAPSSTPIYDVPYEFEVPNQYDEFIDENNNQFVGGIYEV